MKIFHKYLIVLVLFFITIFYLYESFVQPLLLNKSCLGIMNAVVLLLIVPTCLVIYLSQTIYKEKDMV